MGQAGRLFFDFRHAAARRNAFIVLLVAAVLSPNISMPGPLPAVRLEQIILLFLLPSLAIYWWRHRGALRIGWVDIAFVALGTAMAVTLVFAPVVVEDVDWSLRDPFELARVAEMWVLFRLGMTVVADRGLARGTLGAMFAMAIGVTLFAVVQYLDGRGSFNANVTDIWAVAHNLDGVERTGRVVGTIGNANYYGVFSGFLLVLALAPILLNRPMSTAWKVFALAAASAATLSLVMSQSRSATLAILGAMFLGLVFVFFRRRTKAAYPLALGWFVASFVAAVVFVEARPPEAGSWLQRFSIEDIADDSSLTIRVSKWRSVFSGFFESPPVFCEGNTLVGVPPASGHNPADHTGIGEPDPAVVARDEERIEGVGDISDAVFAYYCANKAWPFDQDLEAALVPEFLDEWPGAEGESRYLWDVRPNGFVIGVELEDETNPAGPIYSLGTIPNFTLNSSFETGNNGFDRWFVGGEATAAGTTEEVLFGKQSARLTLPPGGFFYQTIPIELPLDTEYTTGMWVRSADGNVHEVELYLTATLANGDTVDPFVTESFDVPANPEWTRLSMQWKTPEDGRVTVLRVLVRNSAASGEPVELFLDGMTNTQTNFAPSYVTVRDIAPSSLDNELPGFSDSPYIGAGPRKDIELGNVDNEYLLFLDRYGVLGTLAYLALFLGAFRVAFLSWRNDASFVSIVSLAMMVFTVALAVFNITGGSFYHFQIMAVYWLFIGMLNRSRFEERSNDYD